MYYLAGVNDMLCLRGALLLTCFPDLNAKGVILQAFEMFRLKSCIDFKPYEGEKTYIFFIKGSG